MIFVAAAVARVARTKILVNFICAILAWSTMTGADDAQQHKTQDKRNYCRFLQGTCKSNCSHDRTMEGSTPGFLCDGQLVCCSLDSNIQGHLTANMSGDAESSLSEHGMPSPNVLQVSETTDQASRTSINYDTTSLSNPAGVSPSSDHMTTPPTGQRLNPASYKYRGMIIPSVPVQQYSKQLGSIMIPKQNTTSRDKNQPKLPKYKFIQIKDFMTPKGSISEFESTPTTLQASSNTDYRCGVSPAARTKRIVGGTQARRCAYPWMVYIVRDPNKDDLCGGTLVSARHVITAAHCFDFLGANWPKLIFGEYTHGDNTSGDILVTLDYRIATHPSYDRMTYHHDIAVLTLSRPVVFKNCLHPICLPESGQLLSVGSSCTVAGWGSTSRTADFPAVSSPFLMQADVKVVNGRYCQLKYHGMFDKRIHVCAGDLSGRSDSCVGDSGGPLMCSLDDVTKLTDTLKDDRPLYLMGVISAGATPCAQPDTPAVYTDVSKALDWLHSVMRS